MNEIASKGQLRLSFLRWALFTVPLIVFCGFFVGRLSNSGYENRWFDALVKPAIMPPGWVFPIAWSTLYIMLGLAIAMILHARGARLRGLAITFFVLQFLVNLTWSPLFFAAHQVTTAFYVILVMLVLAIITTFLFGRIRKAGAWMMVPYLIWLSFASILNYQIDILNPGAETLVAPAIRTQI